MDLLCWARYVSICSIYFICQKSSHRFLPIFFSVIEDIVVIEFIKQKVGVTVLVKGKTSIYLAIELSLREISYVLRARAHLRALMTQKSCAVGMRNAKLENHLKDVRAHCYCASLVRTLFIGHARATSFSSARTDSKTQQNIERMTFALTWCYQIKPLKAVTGCHSNHFE